MCRTVTISCGSMELDDTCAFQELRTSGVKVTRLDDCRVVLETTTGFKLRMRSATPITVTPEESQG